MMYEFDNGRLTRFFNEDTVDFTIFVMTRKIFNCSYIGDDGRVVFDGKRQFGVMLYR